MLYYTIYGVLLLLLIFIIYGTLSRKRIYSEVDRLEAWKIKIMNQPVTDEISKIKGLNMSGETEQKFESWRNNWDEIVTVKLPDLEEHLFDVEEAANKYRFVKAKNIANNIAKELSAIEDSLNEMMNEINLLIHSEENNRQQIEDIRKLFREVKKAYSQKKGILGTTVYAFEKRFEEIEKSFQRFEEATKDGNYFEAREILNVMKEEINNEKWKMDEVPKILVQIETEVPTQLEELLKGISEMEAEGYILEYFPFKKNIHEMKKQLLTLLPFMEEGNIEAAQTPIQEIHNEIEQIYETLEQEVLAKQFVNYELPSISESTENLQVGVQELKDEVENIKLSYRIPEEELKNQLKLDKQTKEMLNKLRVIEDIAVNKKQSYLTIKKSIEEFKIELSEIESILTNCNHTITTLRKDELKAKETLKDLREKIRQGQRLITKSNIPGLPDQILTKLEEAQTSLIAANEKMEQIPLVMDQVNDSMEDALDAVNEVFSLITFTIEQALSAERVIQYGNRFRSRYSYIDEELILAEEAFRRYQYEEALEIAYKAIEAIDPSVNEKINFPITEKV